MTAKRLMDLGFGYLTLDRASSTRSTGERQRMKLASEMGRTQDDSVFIFDEPSINLHPLGARTLLRVFQIFIRDMP